MRTELGNKKKLRWMIGLMAVAIIAMAYDFHGFFDTAPPTPPGTTTSSPASKLPAKLQTERAVSLNPEVLSNSQQKFEFGTRNIFRMQEIATTPKKSSDPPPNHSEPPPADPPKPSLPFTFYGYADRRDEPRRIFLLDSDTIFLAKIGDTVAGRYKVIEISRQSVTIEDTLQNLQQRIPLLSK